MSRRARKEAARLLKENPEVMDKVMLKQRNDPKYMSKVYMNSPSMRKVMTDNPNMDTLLNDEKIRRSGFENIYRDAGGELLDPKEEADRKARELELETKRENEEFERRQKELEEEEEEDPEKKSVWKERFKTVGMLAGKIFLIKKVFDFAMNPLKMFSCFGGGGDLDLNQMATQLENPDTQSGVQDMMENADSNELSEIKDNNNIANNILSDPNKAAMLTDPNNLRSMADLRGAAEFDFMDSFQKAMDGDFEGMMGGDEELGGFGDDADIAGGEDIDLGEADFEESYENDDFGEGEEEGEFEEEEGEEEEEEEEEDDDDDGDDDSDDDSKKKEDKKKKAQAKKNAQKQQAQGGGAGAGLVAGGLAAGGVAVAGGAAVAMTRGKDRKQASSSRRPAPSNSRRSAPSNSRRRDDDSTDEGSYDISESSFDSSEDEMSEISEPPARKKQGSKRR